MICWRCEDNLALPKSANVPDAFKGENGEMPCAECAQELQEDEVE
jgi:hypothetical protein